MNITDADIALSEVLTPADQKEAGAAHGIGFFIPDVEEHQYPNGFWHSRTVSGLKKGFGFYCWKCHLLIRANAPESVWHCGKREFRDDSAKMLTHRLGSYVAYSEEIVAEWLKEQEPKPEHADLLAPRRTVVEWIKSLF
jgi:hypothetical protein